MIGVYGKTLKACLTKGENEFSLSPHAPSPSLFHTILERSRVYISFHVRVPFTLDLFLHRIVQHILDFSTIIVFHCVSEQPVFPPGHAWHLGPGSAVLWRAVVCVGGYLTDPAMDSPDANVPTPCPLWWQRRVSTDLASCTLKGYITPGWYAIGTNGSVTFCWLELPYYIFAFCQGCTLRMFWSFDIIKDAMILSCVWFCWFRGAGLLCRIAFWGWGF